MVPWAHLSLQLKRFSIGSAVFTGLTSVTDRQTDHATRLVTTDRFYVRSTGDAVYKIKVSHSIKFMVNP